MIAMISDLLRRFGFPAVSQAKTVTKAEEISRKSDLDLILCDCMAAETNGLALASQIRTNSGNVNQLVPLILMTAKADRETIFGGRDAGINEFIRKPFTAVDLFKKVVSVIDNPRAFISAEDYFGPDRRRRKLDEFEGGDRREQEAKIVARRPR